MARSPVVFFMGLTVVLLIAAGLQGRSFKELEVRFSNEDITLVGTLTLPEGPGPHPAVILLTGSGPQNRDEEIEGVAGYAPFRVIAEYLSSRGIAVLRYDDRGTGQSTGAFAQATTHDFADDAEAALDYLLSRQEIDFMRLGLLGHSEGAAVAAIVAARRPDVAFVVSLAGPAVSGYETILKQVELILLASGQASDVVSAAVTQQKTILDLVLRQDWETLETILLGIKRMQLAVLPLEQRKAMGDLNELARQLAKQELTVMQSPWYRYFLVYNPADDWSKIRVPVLAIFGGRDVQVDVEQNKNALEYALRNAGNNDFTIVVLPEANHLFQLALTGGIEEYALLPKELHPQLLPLIVDWILSRFMSIRN